MRGYEMLGWPGSERPVGSEPSLPVVVRLGAKQSRERVSLGLRMYSSRDMMSFRVRGATYPHVTWVRENRGGVSLIERV